MIMETYVVIASEKNANDEPSPKNIIYMHRKARIMITLTIPSFSFCYTHCIDSVYDSGCLEPLPVNEWFPINKETAD